MGFGKRIAACIIVMLLLAFICIIGYISQEEVETMGEIFGGENRKKIALTFDDGPHPYYTLQLLEGLKERDVKVTFFITGKNAEA